MISCFFLLLIIQNWANRPNTNMFFFQLPYSHIISNHGSRNQSLLSNSFPKQLSLIFKHSEKRKKRRKGEKIQRKWYTAYSISRRSQILRNTVNNHFYCFFNSRGPTLSPVALLCFTWLPSHNGKVPDRQHLVATKPPKRNPN